MLIAVGLAYLAVGYPHLRHEARKPACERAPFYRDMPLGRAVAALFLWPVLFTIANRTSLDFRILDVIRSALFCAYEIALTSAIFVGAYWLSGLLATGPIWRSLITTMGLVVLSPVIGPLRVVLPMIVLMPIGLIVGHFAQKPRPP